MTRQTSNERQDGPVGTGVPRSLDLVTLLTTLRLKTYAKHLPAHDIVAKHSALRVGLVVDVLAQVKIVWVILLQGGSEFFRYGFKPRCKAPNVSHETSGIIWEVCVVQALVSNGLLQ